MLTISDKKTLRDQLVEWHQVGETVALVPTMGNLHKGHMSLAKLAAAEADHVVVSVFVNPTQFGPAEDFAAYPRTLTKDARQLSRAGVDILYTPSVEGIYPLGIENPTRVSVPVLSETLCGEKRPGHFEGVTSVVLRLLNIVSPNVAVFGEKDYQQLAILRLMVEELHMHTRVVAGQTERDESGLAMSSRNQYLTDAEMLTAPLLYATLCTARDKFIRGNTNIASIESEAMAALEAAGFVPDYVSLRRAADLSVPEKPAGKLIVLAAATLGKARLIDNLQFEN
jgi:pantoate--beta-alanine ligase